MIQNRGTGKDVMARSKYIYHIRHNEDGLLVASFTVKKEANEWLIRCGFSPKNYTLSRMCDGCCEYGKKYETKVEWDELCGRNK